MKEWHQERPFERTLKPTKQLLQQAQKLNMSSKYTGEVDHLVEQINKEDLVKSYFELEFVGLPMWYRVQTGVPYEQGDQVQMVTRISKKNLEYENLGNTKMRESSKN